MQIQLNCPVCESKLRTENGKEREYFSETNCRVVDGIPDLRQAMYCPDCRKNRREEPCNYWLVGYVRDGSFEIQLVRIKKVERVISYERQEFL